MDQDERTQRFWDIMDEVQSWSMDGERPEYYRKECLEAVPGLQEVLDAYLAAPPEPTEEG